MLQELEQLVEKKKNTCDEKRRLRADDIRYSKLKYAHLFINTIVSNIHSDGKITLLSKMQIQTKEDVQRPMSTSKMQLRILRQYSNIKFYARHRLRCGGSDCKIEFESPEILSASKPEGKSRGYTKVTQIECWLRVSRFRHPPLPGPAIEVMNVHPPGRFGMPVSHQQS